MSVREKAVSFMEQIALDDSHGYSQLSRWESQGTDFDCSSLIITAFKKAGIPLACTFTGNMYADMASKGFNDVTDGVDLATGEGLKRGDVLLAHNSKTQHTEIYCGNGLMCGARSDENGDVYGYIPGDQDGHEIAISEYYNKNWDYVLRYIESDEPEEIESYEFTFQDVFLGCTGAHVNLLQRLLKVEGFYKGKVDGSCGSETAKAIKDFQQHKIDNGVNVGTGGADGWCGVSTWRAILAI